MSIDPEDTNLFTDPGDVDPELWAAVQSQDHRARALRTGAVWDGRCYSLDLVGRSLEVDPETQSILAADGGPVSFQEALVLLAYLTGDGPGGLAGERISFLNLPGGALFFAKTHTLATDELAAQLDLTAERFAELGAGLAASDTGRGEASWLLWALPQVPMEAFFFTGDDEFDSRITLLVDAGADRYLALDGLWATVNLLARNMVRLDRGAGLGGER